MIAFYDMIGQFVGLFTNDCILRYDWLVNSLTEQYSMECLITPCLTTESSIEFFIFF